MTTATESLLQTLVEVEHHLQMTHTWLAEMSKQDSEMRTYIKGWTVPRNRYEKRVGNANALFERMDWDEIMAFAQTHEQDDPWKVLCMLEHLSHRSQAKTEIFKDVIRHMRTASESCILDKGRAWLMTATKSPKRGEC